MAYDRFIRWGDNSPPPIEELESVLRRYLGDAGTVERKDDWLYAKLAGEPKYVFRPTMDDIEWEKGGTKNGERWFEVCCPQSVIRDGVYDVITRNADEFTNALADGFCKLIARYWGGTIDE